MLEPITKFAMEMFEGDAAAAQDFVQGFVAELEKTAAAPGQPGAPGTSRPSDIASGFMKALGGGLGSAAIGMGMHGVSSMVSSLKADRLHGQFLAALQKAISSNRILREANKDKVKNYAETVFRFAPHVATDANLLSSVLANAVHGEGLDPMTIRSLTDLEGRFVDNATSPAFSLKGYN
jgi:hypothetical protein